MSLTRLKAIFFLLIILITNSVSAQNLKFYGSQFFKFYQDEKLQYVTQVWHIIQDKRGVMYFGSNGDLVINLGNDWIDLSFPATVRSFDFDKNGRLYMGLSGDLGYLDPDSLGYFSYTSLKNLLPDSVQFHDIWKTYVDEKDNAVYFISGKKIFYYKDNKLKVIDVDLAAMFASKLYGDIYIFSRTKGISILHKGSIKPVKGSEKLPELTSYVNCLEYSRDTILVVSSQQGMFLLNRKTGDVKDLAIDKSILSFAKEKKVLAACKLNNNNFALGSFYGGIVIFNKNGELVNFYNTAKGLPTDCIYYLYSDKNHNLWAGTQMGIVKIETSSPFQYFDKYQNINSYNTAVAFFKNRFYLGTLDSLYYLENFKFGQKNIQLFKSIPGVEAVWDLLAFKNKLFASGRAGVHLIEDTISTHIFSYPNTILCMGKSSKFDDYIFLGYRGGLLGVSFDSLNENLVVIKNFKNVDYEIRDITSDPKGNLWLSTLNDGLIYIKFGNSIDEYKVRIFADNYFEDVTYMTAVVIDGKIDILSRTGIYQPVYDPNTDTIKTFVKDSNWSNSFQDSTQITNLIKVNDTLFFYYGSSIGLYVKKGDKQYKIPNIFNRVQDDIVNINAYKNYLFLMSSSNFYVYDLKVHKNYNMPFNTIITNVIVNNDSTIFYGNFYKIVNDSIKVLSTNQTDNFYPILKYSENSISFKFSATDFQDEENTEYKYILEGFEKNWHKYSKENKAVYTNLREGKYTFKVVARNIYGTIGNPATYSFEILPPWYRTWWAYILYTISGILIIFLIVRLYTLRLKQQNIKLEQIVRERTREIMEKNEELMQQKKEILAQAKELAKLTLVAEKTDNAVIIFDENLNIEWVNEAFRRIYKENYIGKNLLETSNIENIAEIVQEIKTKKTSVEVTHKLQKKGLEGRWLKTTFSPVLNHSNKIEKIIAIETDITEIKQAQELIEAKNNLINSSLTYAVSIQQSILPKLETIREFFEIEILFRPRDIVSGDFYWFAEKYSNKDRSEYQIFFAVADCTGHGVPGAFMSLITSRLLEEIINMRNIVDPAQALKELANKIETVLRQHESLNSDGVDIALCRFTKTSNNDKIEMLFAGAKLPIFYYDKNELKRIKGDSISIGGNIGRRDKNFTNKTFYLSKGDILYLITDGYIDQNNIKRKKIGTPKFMEIVVSNIDKTIAEQIKILEDYLDQWQGDAIQRDDITVAGIRII